MIGKKKNLLINTFMLYLIQFSNYFFNFIIIPYQTRIMGPIYYGKIGFATALMVYFQLFVDFGFILSATESVAKNREDKSKVSQIYTSITIIKVIFGVMSIGILSILCLINNQIKNDSKLYFLYLLGVIIYSFLPDYLYRGLERMKEVTYRTISVKIFFTIMIFLFLKKPEDYLVVPALLAIGNLFAVIWAHYDLNKNFGIKFCKITRYDIIENLKKSASFFLSRIASTIYTSTNTVILGFIDKTGSIVGYYTAADKLMSSGKNILSPISDSIYPYMVKNKDFKLVKKILFIFMPIISLFTIIAFIFADQICSILFGEEFVFAGNILRAMLPMAITTLPNYVLGFPTLGAMGISHYANKSIYYATIIHIVGLIVLYLSGNISVLAIAILASITDFIILLFRIYFIYMNRNLLNRKGKEVYEHCN